MIRSDIRFFVFVCRVLKNEKAGIDITIPEYKEVSGRLGLSNEEEYNVIVITRLPHFKTEHHQPADVVQFMVNILYHHSSVYLRFKIARHL